MALFQKKISFKEFTTYCLIDWADDIYGNKDALTISAQNESGYRLSQKQIEILWTNLEYFYLTEVYILANQHSRGALEARKISEIVSTIYVSYLVHQRGMPQGDALELLDDKYAKFSESILETAIAGAQQRADQAGKDLSYEEVLNVASESFCTQYAYVDISTGIKTESDAGDNYSGGMFDSERIAFKLIRGTLGGLQERFNNSKIIW